MELVFALGAVIVGATLFFFWRDVDALRSLKNGKYGPFKITRVSDSGTAQLAVDAENKKIALIGVGVPQFNGQGATDSFVNMTVVFEYADVSNVSITLNDTTAEVAFYFHKPIPSWNKLQRLSFYSGEPVRVFFAKYLPSIKVAVHKSNKYGGTERVE